MNSAHPSRTPPSRRGRSRSRLIAGACGLALAMAGCSSEAETGPIVGADEAFTAFAAPILDDARAEGASDTQLALMERTIAEGWVSPSVVEEALAETFACFEDAGIQVFRDPITVGVELPVISYSYSSSASTDPVADACLTENSMWVEMMYQVQPKAIEETDELFEQNRAYLIECLREHGRTIEDDAPVGDIKQALILSEEEMAHLESDGVEAAWGTLAINCASDVGIDGF